MEKEWEQLKLNNELHILENVLMRGSKMGQLYRSKIIIQSTVSKYLVIFDYLK